MKPYLSALAGIALGFSVIALPVHAQPSSGEKPELTSPQGPSNNQPSPNQPTSKQTLPSQKAPGPAASGTLNRSTGVPPITQSTMSDDEIDARYKAAREQCKALSGAQKDVCVERAKTDRDVAQAERKADRKKSKADDALTDTRRDVDFDVEMKRCAPLSGGAKDRCEDAAKAKYGK